MLSDTIVQLFHDAGDGDMASVVALVAFSGVYLLVTAILQSGLWKREGESSKKVFWSLVLLIPVLGWLFYLAFYRLPPSCQHR